jgi:hypothetical protein
LNLGEPAQGAPQIVRAFEATKRGCDRLIRGDEQRPFAVVEKRFFGRSQGTVRARRDLRMNLPRLLRIPRFCPIPVPGKNTDGQTKARLALACPRKSHKADARK